MKLIRSGRKKKHAFAFYVFLIGIILSGFSLILYFIIPTILSSNYYQKSIDLLRKDARSIKTEFSNLISDIKQKQNFISSLSFPSKEYEIFTLFKKMDMDTNTEGIGYCTSQGKLRVWLGNLSDLETILPESDYRTLLEKKSSFLVKDKASVFLVSSQKVMKKGYVVFFKLLSFDPQFKTSHLKEYQFLKPELLKHVYSILYYDFQEDVSGFERFFSKHDDEYIGQPTLQDKIQTLFFPLRNEENQIVAMINLSSPSPASFISTQKESILLAFYVLLVTSLFFLVFFLIKTTPFYREKKAFLFLFILLILVGLRFILLPMSQLEKIKSFPVFSPSFAGFISFANLTKSPADIFLTFMFLLLVIFSLVLLMKNIFRHKKLKLSFPLSLAINLSIIASVIFLSISVQKLLKIMILNSNVNLLRFSFSFPFILLHLSILFLFSSFLLTIAALLRAAYLCSSRFFLSLFLLILGFSGYSFFFEERAFLSVFIIQLAVVTFLLAFSFFPSLSKRKEIFVLTFMLSALFLYVSIHLFSSWRSQSLIQYTLKNTVLSQEHWGNFLLSQSLPEIDDRRDIIISYFNNPELPGFAQSLWRETSISKFNWYSSLEIWDPEGKVLSRFSLNVPKLYLPRTSLPGSREWSISYLNVPLMGKENNFLVAYKDWFEENIYLGRTILTLPVNFDMLPFLYSANPYFELIRVTSLPSLNQLDFGFAVFDMKGKLLFNPSNISSSIRSELLERIRTNDCFWASFKDKNRSYRSFYFEDENRIYSFFVPVKNFVNYSVEFLKLLFLYIIAFFFFFPVMRIIIEKKKLKNPLWSFSNKVYASFISIAIIPLLLFTFITRNFVERIFAQQFIEKAEVHANFARSVVEDLIFLQQEEKPDWSTLLEDMALWISSTIANDVNFYKDGRLISSSRREFFNSGLLPGLIDWEIYYNIQFENNPFYTQKQKIGDYSFHTLTIPFSYRDSFLLISLPFPFEQQEISKTTEEFIEFLVFISVFFVLIVLIFARGMGAMIITPIKKLLAGTKEVSLGNLDVSIEHKPQDEMRTLIDGFNAMIENLKKHEQEISEMSKKVAWAEMARRVAHEIKNPLTPIQLSAEHLLKVYSDQKEDFTQVLKESASYIIKEVENLRQIAKEFLDISREEIFQKEKLNLKELIQEAVNPYKQALSERIRFREKYEGEDFNIEGNKDKIRIALRNIFINAIEAIRTRGEIKIYLKREKDSLTLIISDTGIGISKEMLEKVFDPRYSTKDVGTGLGLSIAKKIIEDHEGTIRISSEPGKGTRVILKFFLSPK